MGRGTCGEQVLTVLCESRIHELDELGQMDVRGYSSRDRLVGD